MLGRNSRKNIGKIQFMFCRVFEMIYFTLRKNYWILIDFHNKKLKTIFSKQEKPNSWNAGHLGGREIIGHHEDGEPNEEWIPSEYCNQTMYGHPQVVYRQRSISAELGECSPCPGSLH